MALRAKFSDPDLRLRLLDTKDSRLEEASPTDMYWGYKEEPARRTIDAGMRGIGVAFVSFYSA